MKINYFLLPVKAHFLLLFAGTAPLLPYLPVYMQQELQMSYKVIGLIYAILPFFGLISKASSGVIADAFCIHRAIFLGSIVVCGLGFFSIYFTLPLPTEPNPQPGHLQFDCSSPSSYIRHALPQKSCGKKEFRSNETSTCELTCTVSPDEVKKICAAWNISLPHCSEEIFEISAFSYLNHSIADKTEIFFLVSNLTYFGNEVTQPTCQEPLRMNCTARCDNPTLMKYIGAATTVPLSSYSQILDQPSFWIFFLCMALAWSGLSVCVVMSDTICFKLLGPEVSKYGEQRMFGSIGWGLLVIVTGFVIDVNSDLEHKNYVGAFILCICLMSVDFLVATKLKVEGGHKDQKRKFGAIFNLARNPRILLFVLCCFIVGLSTGVFWTYQLLLVEQTASLWDCNFEHLKLLQGLIIGLACFGGELPFFFLSGWFIEKLGHIHAMSLVIGMFGLRFILYSMVSNPWFYLPIELLSGFTFGIFYAVMTSYASFIAPPGTEATMQGIVGATFEGLGMASGGLTGGALFAAVGGWKTFLFVGIFNACFAFIHIFIQMFLNVVAPQPDAGYVPPSETNENLSSVCQDKTSCLEEDNEPIHINKDVPC